MVAGLDPESRTARAELDASLEVRSWQVPGTLRYRRGDVPAGAPEWWRGDAEASQSFLREMGVSLRG